MFEVGPFNLTWSDLKAWNEITGYELGYWELITTKRLARIYHNSFQEYDNTKSISPFVSEKHISKVEKSMRETLRQPLGHKGMGS